MAVRLLTPIADKVQSQLVQALSHDGLEENTELRNVLSEIGDSETLVPLLTEYCDNDQTLDLVAGRSCRHVLGFDKIVLLRVPELLQLRLHVWWPTEARLIEHIHSHRFAFASRIVRGELSTDIFKKGDQGEELFEYWESSRDGQQEWQFRSVGVARLERSIQAHFNEGSYYALSAEMLHRVRVPSGSFVVSIFVQTRTLRSWSSVFVELDRQPPDARTLLRFTPTEMRQRLLTLRERLNM